MNVELAVAGARDAVRTAEKELSAALTAVRGAEDQLCEAERSLRLLERLRDRVGGDEPA